MLLRRFVPIVLTVLLVVAPLAAQGTAGWKVRVDRSTMASDPDGAGEVKFMAMGSGFHAINPQAAVFWKPGDSTGDYTVRGQFTLLKPSDHNNYYGLVFGARNLEGPQQAYIYFMVAQDGTWFIKRRDGSATEDIAKQSSPAVRKPGADGKSTNLLEIRVRGDMIAYSVNGTTVHTTPKTGVLANTDGATGFRINHRLEVQVDNFGVS